MPHQRFGQSGSTDDASHGFSASRSTLPVAPPPPPSPKGKRNEDASPQSEEPKPSLLSQSKMFAEEQWQKAYSMLENNPSLMTGGILVLALKRRAPVNLIRFMLKLNPDAASIPKKGPSPLQIALQSQCPIEVVKELIQACPFALVATNPGSHLDPLSYAKRFRPKESDLILLLSHPVSYWIPEKNQNGETSSVKYSYKRSPPPPPPMPSIKTGSASSIPPFLRYPCGTDAAAVAASALTGSYEKVYSAMDPTELNNVKLICLATLKGHKRLSREMLTVQNQIDEVATASSAAFESASSFAQEQVQMADVTKALQSQSVSILEKVQDQQQKVARTQLVALEMKEQAMRAHIRKMEHRILETVQKYKDESADSLEIRLNAVVEGLQSRLSVFSRRIDSIENRVPETPQPIVVLPDSPQRSKRQKKKKKKKTAIRTRPTLGRTPPLFRRSRSRTAMHRPMKQPSTTTAKTTVVRCRLCLRPRSRKFPARKKTHARCSPTTVLSIAPSSSTVGVPDGPWQLESDCFSFFARTDRRLSRRLACWIVAVPRIKTIHY